MYPLRRDEVLSTISLSAYRATSAATQPVSSELRQIWQNKGPASSRVNVARSPDSAEKDKDGAGGSGKEDARSEKAHEHYETAIEALKGRLAELSAELADCRAQKSQAEVEADSQTARVGTLEAELHDSKAHTLKCEAALRDSREEIANAEAEVKRRDAQMEGAASRQTARAQKLEEALEVSKAELERCRTRLSEAEARAETERERSTVEVARVRTELDGKDKQLAEDAVWFTRELEESRTRLATIERELVQARAETVDKATRLSEVEKNLEAVKPLVPDLQKRLASSEGQADKVQAELARVQIELAQARMEVNDKTTRLSEAEAELEKSRARLSQVEASLEAAKPQISDLQDELARSRKWAYEARVELVQTHADAQRSREDLADTCAALERARAGEESKTTRLASIEADLARARAEVGNKAAQLAFIEAQVQRKTRRVSDMEAELATARKLHEDVAATAELERMRAEAATAQLARSEAGTARLQQRLAHETGERRRWLATVQRLSGTIRVFCRMRPRLATRAEGAEKGEEMLRWRIEAARGLVVSRNDSARHSVPTTTPRLVESTFVHDRFFGPAASDDEVWDEVLPLVDSTLGGGSGSAPDESHEPRRSSQRAAIFAYGQTGSGKTYTIQMLFRRVARLIFDADGDGYAEDDEDDDDDDNGQDGGRVDATVSCIELYKTDVHDCLRDVAVGDSSRQQKTAGSRTPAHSPSSSASSAASPSAFAASEDYTPMTAGTGTGHPRDATVLTARSARQLVGILDAGSRQRNTRTTSANEQSSRSHALFTLGVAVSTGCGGGEWEEKEGTTGATNTGGTPGCHAPPTPDGRQQQQKQQQQQQQQPRRNYLCLVDLAGNEDFGTSSSSAEGLDEAKTINGGLLALERVISVLASSSSPPPPPSSSSSSSSSFSSSVSSVPHSSSPSSPFSSSSSSGAPPTTPSPRQPRPKQQPKHQQHVPYSSHALTRLLQPVLGGGGRVAVMLTLSPLDRDVAASLKTLRFGDGCRRAAVP